MMRYRLLGPLEVVGDDGATVALGGDRERVLLGTLILGSNQVVSTSRLIDALWGEDPPPTATNTLQVHLSKLRKKLAVGSSEGPIESSSSGYLLRTGPGEVDLQRFEELIGQTPIDPADESAQLEEALGLWRGPALADVPSDLLAGERARLDELRLVTLERRIEADLDLGRHVQLVGALEVLVHDYPLRDQSRRQLMVALYRSGRQADALAVYRAGREHLADELGIDPSPALQKLELAILNQAPELDPDVTRWPTATARHRPTGTVTFLFTDIEGSTRLWEDHPDAMGPALRRHDEILRTSIESSGGYVFKTVGDAFCAAFESAIEGLEAARAAQWLLNAEQWPAPVDLRVRMALHTGSCEERGGDYFGPTTLNRIARLMAVAHGGQTVVSLATAELVHDRLPDDLVLRDLGEQRLKDLSRPERVFQLEADGLTVEFPEIESPQDEKEAASIGVPLPSHLTIESIAGFVGREQEVSFFVNAFKPVAEGGGRKVVLVSGEAGIGKTTLVSQFARFAFDSGACVLLGRCEQDLGAPYAPFAEALHHYVTYAPRELLRSHVQSHGSELVRLTPTLRQRLGRLPALQSVDPNTERYLFFGAVVGLLAKVSTTQPVVLILDDLQWADKPSLQLLRHVVKSADPMRLMIVGTYRDADLSGADPLTETLVTLRRELDVDSLELRGLEDTEVIAFMEAIAGHELNDEGLGLARALYRDTDGNPFFVGEILRHLSETGAIVQGEDGRWSSATDPAEMDLPDSVRQVVETRVARLGEFASQALSVASVIGPDFELELLARVTGRTHDELLDTLDSAVRAALIQEQVDTPGHFTFSHALIQHTVYQGIGITRRALMHRRVAEALEDICKGDPGERIGALAYHWANATLPIDVAKAVFYAQQAAEAALESLAPDEAVRYYSEALQFRANERDPDPLIGIDLLIGLGHAQRQAGIGDYRDTFFDAAHRAQQLGATDRLVQAALGNSRGLPAVGEIDTDRVAIIEAALSALPGRYGTERARLLATLCAEVSFGPLEQRLALADEAKLLARRLRDPTTLIQVLNLVNLPLGVPWLCSERLQDSSEALGLAKTLGDPVLLFLSATSCRLNATQSGDFELAGHCLDLEKELSERLRQPLLLSGLALHMAGAALIAGDPEQAEHQANVYLQIATDSGQPDAFAYYGAHLMVIRHQQGRLGELVPLIEQVAAENPGISGFRAALAVALLDVGERQRAHQLMEAFSADGFSSVPEDPQWLDTMICLAELAFELRLSNCAEKLLRLLEPYREQVPFTSMPFEPVIYFLGKLASVLGSHDQADGYFAGAASLNTRGSMRFSEARTDVAWGQMLRARGAPGDQERARRLLEHALAASVANGYGAVERQAAQALATWT